MSAAIPEGMRNKVHVPGLAVAASGDNAGQTGWHNSKADELLERAVKGRFRVVSQGVGTRTEKGVL